MQSPNITFNNPIYSCPVFVAFFPKNQAPFWRFSCEIRQLSWSWFAVFLCLHHYVVFEHFAVTWYPFDQVSSANRPLLHYVVFELGLLWFETGHVLLCNLRMAGAVYSIHLAVGQRTHITVATDCIVVTDAGFVHPPPKKTPHCARPSH